MSATASPPAAALPTMLLQTAASLENLLVDAYTTALGLPCLKDAAANAGLRAFLTAARGHHAAHANGFNAAVRRLGGAPQYAPDPRFAATVPRDLAALTDPASVASLLAALEDTAAQSYVRFTVLAPVGGARGQFAAVAPVEAQHRAVLLIAHALPGARLAAQTAEKGGESGSDTLAADDAFAGPSSGALSSATANGDAADGNATQRAQAAAAIGTAGLPASFYPTSAACAVNEGAVR